MPYTLAFHDNEVDSGKFHGGYLDWQFVPNGPVTDTGRTSKPITLHAVYLHATKPNHNYSIYEPEKSINFHKGEKISLEGEYNQSN